MASSVTMIFMMLYLGNSHLRNALAGRTQESGLENMHSYP